MQAIINFNDYADISSFKKILETFKGVKDYQILNDSENNEDWFDEEFLSKQTDSRLDELLEKSLQESREGKVAPYNSVEMRAKFKRKMPDAEYDRKFSQLLDKSFEQFEEGKFQEATPEFLNRAFRR